jgi:hypothetical protein
VGEIDLPAGAGTAYIVEVMTWQELANVANHMMRRGSCGSSERFFSIPLRFVEIALSDMRREMLREKAVVLLALNFLFLCNAFH